MSELSEKILKEVEEKKIVPVPRCYFLCREYSLWIFFVIAVFCASLAISTIIFMLADYDWEIYKYLSRSFLVHVLLAVPYFWLIVLCLVTLVSYLTFKYTRQGYLFQMYAVVLGCVSFSLVLGVVLFYSGVNSQVHEVISQRAPFYEKLIYDKDDNWNRPACGLLSGEITEVRNNNNFIIRDFSGNLWEMKGENIVWPKNVSPERGVLVKVVGQREDSTDIFFVKLVKQWECSLCH